MQFPKTTFQRQGSGKVISSYPDGENAIITMGVFQGSVYNAPLYDRSLKMTIHSLHIHRFALFDPQNG